MEAPIKVTKANQEKEILAANKSRNLSCFTKRSLPLITTSKKAYTRPSLIIRGIFWIPRKKY